MVPIPIGVKRVSSVHGKAWKYVSCEGCQQTYAYQLDLEARGENIDLLFLDSEGFAGELRRAAAGTFSETTLLGLMESESRAQRELLLSTLRSIRQTWTACHGSQVELSSRDAEVFAGLTSAKCGPAKS